MSSNMSAPSLSRTQQAAVYATAEYLYGLVASKAVAPDAVEGVEVAIQCLGEAFGVDLSARDQAAEFSLVNRATSLDQLIATALGNTTTGTTVPAEPAAPQKAPAAAEPDPLATAEGFKNQGNIQLKDTLYEAAIDSYTKALQASQDVRNASSVRAIYYGNRAAAYMCVKNFEEAARDCEEAINLDPAYAKAYSRLGLARLRMGQFAASITAYQKAIELDPTNDRFKTELKQAEERQRQQQQQRPPLTSDLPASGTAPPNLFGNLGSGGGGGGGGLPNLGDFGSLLNNPAMINMATQMMQSGAFNEILSNPTFSQMAQNMFGGASGGSSGGRGRSANSADEND